MVRRTITALLLLALLIPAILLGGLPYFLLVAVFVGIAAWEYSRMFQLKGYHPSTIFLVLCVVLILGTRAFWPAAAGGLLAFSILAAAAIHLYAFERGSDSAAVDLAIGLGAIAYFGWVSAYLLDVRLLPNGAWWLILILATVWIADSMAYFVGIRYGRHKMTPRLSPKKSWEGYFAGVIVGTAFASLLAWACSEFGPLQLAWWQGLFLGFVLSALTTLGDLTESLFKRFAGVKDSGDFLPGHGGAFDRIDSLIWAGMLGYFCIPLLLR